MTKETVDAVFVVNADVTIDAIQSLAREHGLLSAVFVTTHQYYPNETEALSSLFPSGARFLTFAGLLSPAELDSADEQARQALVAEGVPPNRFVAGYEETINRLKNDWVRAKVEGLFTPGRIFCAGGLGIIAASWASQSTVLLNGPSTDETPSVTSRVMARLLRRREYSLYSDSAQSYLLVGTAKRIPFARTPRWSLTLPKILGNALIAAARLLPSSMKPRISCSIHDRLQGASHIFVDGYHPSNYPYSYLGSFREDSTFLVPTRVNGAWFERFGFTVEVLPDMLEEPAFEYVPKRGTPSKKTRILLLLNHAGDWTAIINRSDTERLVIAFCALAGKMPDTEFVVRPHPTAVHPRHEGPHAISRIHDHVAWLGCSNLSLSSSTLEHDIDGADLCISEYSLTLINCYAKGKPALVANLTGRRSLMEDYQRFGFAYAETEGAMSGAVRDFVSSPDAFIEGQNAAVQRYTEVLQDLRGPTRQDQTHDA